jgi:hypothetical protein
MRRNVPMAVKTRVFLLSEDQAVCVPRIPYRTV